MEREHDEVTEQKVRHDVHEPTVYELAEMEYNAELERNYKHFYNATHD